MAISDVQAATMGQSPALSLAMMDERFARMRSESLEVGGAGRLVGLEIPVDLSGRPDAASRYAAIRQALIDAALMQLDRADTAAEDTAVMPAKDRSVEVVTALDDAVRHYQLLVESIQDAERLLREPASALM